MKGNIFFAVLVLAALAFVLTIGNGGQTFAESPPPAPTPEQKPADSQQPKRLDAEFVKFFVGSWNCAGEFTNGKKIEADLEFKLDLEGKWLQYRHIDRPPNTFKASAMWGIDSGSGKFISMMQDNFGGARLFTSEGWVNGSIRFQNAPFLSEPKYRERFTFARQTENKFRMDWELSSDGVNWQLGDYIVCTKNL